MILVVCALPAELRYVAQRAGVDVLSCGIGPVEAAVGVANALAHTRYDAVVNAGIGGAFRGAARVGDAVIVSEETLADFGLEGGGALSLPDGAALVERAFADAALLGRTMSAGVPLARGLTVAEVTATDATAARLRARYAADVESMEGFSVLRAAAVAKIPALEIRGVSNYVGDRASAEWDFAAGARATARALEIVLDRIA
ncbi:MAG: futalosine hydrolase [Candidatus Eremiobacteraeota bacterium]|nr:futalosine hydrolase [Candidatus Eremiobacteraeota bacterium]